MGVKSTRGGMISSGSPAVGTTGRSISFDEFVDAALGAALKAAERHTGSKPGKLPWPIWIGIVAGPIDRGTFGGGGFNQ